MRVMYFFSRSFLLSITLAISYQVITLLVESVPDSTSMRANTHSTHTFTQIYSVLLKHTRTSTHTHILTLSAEEEKTIASPFLCYTDIFDSTHTHTSIHII